MKAISIAAFGEEPTVIDVDLPAPAAGQVEISLRAASLNPLDGAAAAGHLAGFAPFVFPLVLGFDGAGIVTRVGAGVDGFAVGDRVFGQLWDAPQRYGAFAEAAVIGAKPAFGALEHIPEEISFATAAALPTAGMTGLGAVEAVGAGPGTTVLVLGASGGVGTFALQAAARAGARVLASAATEAADRMRELGADEVVPRGGSDLAAALQRAGAPDSVVDTTGDRHLVAVAAASLRDGGTVVSIAGGVSDELAASDRVNAANFVLDQKPRRLRQLGELVASGQVRAVIGTTIGFDDLPASWRGVPARIGHLRGKTVVRIGADR